MRRHRREHEGVQSGWWSGHGTEEASEWVWLWLWLSLRLRLLWCLRLCLWLRLGLLGLGSSSCGLLGSLLMAVP